MLAFGFVLPFLPLYLREIGVHPDSAVVFWSGALVTSTGVSLAIFSPIWGALADRRGRKLMVLRSMLVGGVIVALMGLIQNVGEFLMNNLRHIQHHTGQLIVLLRRHASIGVDWLGTRNDQPPLLTW